MRGNQGLAGSFRDPSGYVFTAEGVLYRQVNDIYRSHYERLISSGLYERLVDQGLLVPHEEADLGLAQSEGAYKVLRPEKVPFISYPYEWSFSQLQDAALLTLAIERQALDHGMTLKDASAFNIQFVRGKPVLIDTLSFEVRQEGLPWMGYRQFCQHFLAPLSLMAYVDVRLRRLLRPFIDGIPLDLASRLLPLRSRLKAGLYIHVHLHAKSQQAYADRGPSRDRRGLSELALRGMIDSLEATVRGLRWRPRGTPWGDYYSATNYSEEGFAHKRQVVSEYLAAARPHTVWDLGANTGAFSRLAGDQGCQTVAFDVDPAAVELNYLECRESGETHVLPLLLDLTNPPPGLGWASQERMAFVDRGPVDLVMALALVHHLAISNNVPLPSLAAFLARLGGHLIIEFVPKDDPQVQRLLRSREDIFPEYHQAGFEEAFGGHFAIEHKIQIKTTQRTLYLMRGTD
jgi:hypothetical protein